MRQPFTTRRRVGFVCWIVAFRSAKVRRLSRSRRRTLVSGLVLSISSAGGLTGPYISRSTRGRGHEFALWFRQVAAGAASRQFWMPPRASTTAGEVDWLFNLILAISAFFFSLIVVLMLVFVIRYRRRPGVRRSGKTAPTHSTPLELTWTLIPVGIVVYLFYAAFTTFMDMKTPPRRCRTSAWWPGSGAGASSIPTGLRPPSCTCRSAARAADDVLAGRDPRPLHPGLPREDGHRSRPLHAKTWFQAVKPGEYDLYCSQYCGTSHSG